MAVKRKCSACGTWNEDEDHCMKCGQLISPILIEEIRETQREERRNSIPPTKLDLFIESWKHSKYFILRVLFQILYAISFAFIAIASFFAYLAASPNG